MRQHSGHWQKIMLAAFGLALGGASTARALPVYIGLGDSITRGETDLLYAPTAAPGGYVADFAATLAARTGVAPVTVDLGIDGETASSFFSNAGRTPPVAGRTDAPLQLENLNYPGTTLPQSQVFANTVAAQTAAGNTVTAITLTLGFNEVAALAPATNTAAGEAAALAQLPATLAAFRSNDQAVLDLIRSLAPTATVYLEGYYNPFPADPASPAAPLFAAAGPQLNSAIQSLAAANGYIYVDNATPFVGNEAAYTFQASLPAGSSVGGPFGGVLPIGDVHPNALGYSVIAADTAAATVPEPATAALLLTGFGLIALARRSTKTASL